MFFSFSEQAAKGRWIKIGKPSIAIIGAGKVGSALAETVKNLNYRLVGIASRTTESAARLGQRLGIPWTLHPSDITAQADVVFITTSDQYISKVASQIAHSGGFRRGQYVYHTSGCLTASILSPARSCGAFAGSLHPLLAFATTEQVTTNLSGVYFAIDGDAEAMDFARNLITEFGGNSLAVPPNQRAIYHAAACIASNYLVSLIDYAANLFKQLGLADRPAVDALMPLLLGTVDNVSKLGVIQSLTGPISRGDVSTIAGHLEALEQCAKADVGIYQNLGLYTIRLALAKQSIDTMQAARLQEVLINKRVEQNLCENK